MGGERAELGRWVSVAVALAGASLAGCTTASETVPFVEADGGARDSARADTNGSDAAALDASERDTSAPMDDASLPDGASSDAAVDAGPPDFGCIGDEPCAIAQVVAGTQYTCIVRRDGDVYCWGLNDFGRLGFPEAQPIEPTLVPDLPAIQSVAPGHNDSCALSQAGDVYCWGGRYSLELMSTPGVIDWVGVQRLSTGITATTCGVYGDAQLACRGMALDFGPPLSPDGYYTPVEITEPGRVLDVSVSQSHACVLTELGTVWCWGFNDYGQLALPEEIGESPPVQVAGIEGATDVGTGLVSSCALVDGSVYCWGSWPGADGSVVYREPFLFEGFPPLSSLAMSRLMPSVCGITEDQRVHCGGTNDHGQLGAGFVSDGTLNAGVHRVLGLEGIEQVSFGSFHACALDGEGRMWCWGDNEWSQLGDGTTTDRSRPLPFRNPY